MYSVIVLLKKAHGFTCPLGLGSVVLYPVPLFFLRFTTGAGPVFPLTAMIILLNGTSSAGKTTVARILQEKYSDVLLLYGVDTMVQNVFPAKCDFPPFDEQAIKLIISDVDGRPQAELKVSSYMYPVYETAIRYYKMLSEQGYNLIVDEVLFDSSRVTPYFEILAEETVYFIAIKPDKEVVVRREKARGDRIPGLAEGLYDKVYNPLFTYDLVLDTGKLTPNESAEHILACMERNENPRGFLNSAIAWQQLSNTNKD